MGNNQNNEHLATLLLADQLYAKLQKANIQNQNSKNVKIEPGDYMLATVYTYDPAICQYDINAVITERESHKHHIAFIERNEKIRQLNAIISQKQTEGNLLYGDLEQYLYNVKSWNDLVWENNIKAFGIAEARNCYYSSSNFASHYKDIECVLALAYVKALGSYNPYYTAPTTYYKMKFRSAILNYKCNDRNITPHYAGNFKKIADATNRLHQEYGTIPDEEAIQRATGMNAKAYRSTLNYINSARTVSIENDKFYNSGSTYDTPEHITIKNETTERIHAIIEQYIDTLSETEKKVFCAHLDVADGDITKFPEVAKKLNMPINKVRRIFNRIQRNLQKNSELRELYAAQYNHIKHTYIHEPITGEDDAAKKIKNSIKKNKQNK